MLNELIYRLFPRRGRFVGRKKTHDYGSTAIKYRMPAGFPGDVNRVHPFGVEPALIDVTPPTAYGQPVVVNSATQGVRPLAAGDQALTDVYGFTVRPFPIQQNSVNPQFNTGVPPTTGVIDVLRSGYIMVQLGDGTLTGAVKGGQVYVWTAASTGHHVQGAVEAVNPAGSGMAIDDCTFNGTQDANGVCEIEFHI